jgi:hypothetical protein
MVKDTGVLLAGSSLMRSRYTKTACSTPLAKMCFGLFPFTFKAESLKHRIQKANVTETVARGGA